MGRGLSDLQQCILQLGLAAQEAPVGWETPGGYVSCDEVLLDYWRLPDPPSLAAMKERDGDTVETRRRWARLGRERPRLSLAYNPSDNGYCKWRSKPSFYWVLGRRGEWEQHPCLRTPASLNRCRAALTRAIDRLVARGLVSRIAPYRGRVGFVLTEAGLAEARRLTGQDQG